MYGECTLKTFQEVKTAFSINYVRIALSTDVGMNVPSEAYLSITWHYITNDWDIQLICLTTILMQEEHTTSEIAEMLEELVTSY